jgi:hypothetical protein
LKNTPVPMIDPITSAVVLVRVSPRINCESGAGVLVAGLSNP